MLSFVGQESLWDCSLPPPPSSDLALLCKYQQRASCLLCFSKARATLLTFIFICCQTITFLSYERLSRPACLNVVTHRFIIRPLRTELKGPICDPNVNKRVNPAADIQHAGLEWNRLTTRISKLLKDQWTHFQRTYFTLTHSGNFDTKWINKQLFGLTIHSEWVCCLCEDVLCLLRFRFSIQLCAFRGSYFTNHRG